MPGNGEFHVVTWLLEQSLKKKKKTGKFCEPCEKTCPRSRRKSVAELGLSPDPLNPICALTTRQARFNSCLNMILKWESPCATDWNLADPLLPGTDRAVCCSGQLFETNTPSNPRKTLRGGEGFLPLLSSTVCVLTDSEGFRRCTLQKSRTWAGLPDL